MAKNTGKNFRRGSVSNRTQFPHPKNPKIWMKQDATTGRIISGKTGAYKGVAKHVDDRRN